MSRRYSHALPGALMAGLALLLASVPVSAFVVSGHITDSAGNNLSGIRVDIFDQDPLFDDYLARVYTNAAGVFSIDLTSGWGAENPDVFIRVEWMWPLLPLADYGLKHVHLVRKLADDGSGNLSRTWAYTPKDGGVSLDHDPATPLPGKDLAMDQALNPPAAGGLDDLPTLALHINEALNYYRDNKGTVPWAWGEDVIVMIGTNRLGSYVNDVGTEDGVPPPNMLIADVDINGVNIGGFQGRVSDIYHEMGHYVHFRMHGGPLPQGPFSGAHNTDEESDPQFALVEGWPSYVGELTDDLHGNDGKYQDYRDDGTAGNYPPNSLWRGNEQVGAQAKPAGRDPGTSQFESGERVEAAVGGVWFGLDSDPAFGLTTNGHNFDDMLRVFVDDKPNHIRDFAQGLVADVGANTAAARQVYHHLQRHGIVFTRARFAQDPFTLPQAGVNGSAQEVGGRVFLRGVVQTQVEATSPADLGVDQTIGLQRIRIRYQTPSDNLTGTPSGFPPANVTSWGVTSGGAIGFDTTPLADGEYDLLIAGENSDGFEDNFLPTWAPNAAAVPADPGDANTTVDTEEKYLKVLGAWYDRDRNPITNTGPEGKVVVDNTKPTTQIGVTP